MADAVDSQNQNIYTFSTQCLEYPLNHSYQFLRASQTDKQTTPVSYPKHHPLNSCASGNQTTTAGNKQYLVSTVQRQISAHGINLLQSWETQIIFKLPDQALTLFLPSRACKSASAELTLAQGRWMQ